jgi:steroid Delta-isomerase
MTAATVAPEALGRVRDFYESLTPASLQRIGTVYADQAYFKDPFNEVRGLDHIEAIFRHMFVQLRAPRFVVREVVAQGDQAFLTWDFLFEMPRMGAGQQCIRGASHLRFDADGKVGYHRDYWDLAEELYEKLPVLGGLMRYLKRRASA